MVGFSSPLDFFLRWWTSSYPFLHLCPITPTIPISVFANTLPDLLHDGGKRRKGREHQSGWKRASECFMVSAAVATTRPRVSGGDGYCFVSAPVPHLLAPRLFPMCVRWPAPTNRLAPRQADLSRRRREWSRALTVCPLANGTIAAAALAAAGGMVFTLAFRTASTVEKVGMLSALASHKHRRAEQRRREQNTESKHFSLPLLPSCGSPVQHRDHMAERCSCSMSPEAC